MASRRRSRLGTTAFFKGATTKNVSTAALSDSESDAGVAAIPTRPAPANGSAGPKIVGGPDAVIDDEDLPESEREEDNEDEDGEEEEDDV